MILYGFIAGFAFNLMLAGQMVYYWNAPSAKVKGKQKEAVPLAEHPSIASTTATAKSRGPTTRRRG